MRNEWSDDWRSHYSAAEVYEEAQELKKAEESYKQAKELASDDRTKQVMQNRIDAINQ